MKKEIINSEFFWRTVESIQWANDTREPKIIRYALVRNLTKEQIDMFFEDFYAHKSALDDVVSKYVIDTPNHRLPYGGSDSYSDLLSEVISRGQAFYEHAIAYPESLAFIKVKESFAYCIPNNNDFMKLDDDYWSERAQDALKSLTAMKSHYTVHPIMAEHIEALLMLIVSGELNELPWFDLDRSKYGDKDNWYYIFSCLAEEREHYEFSNLFADITAWRSANSSELGLDVAVNI